MSKSLAEPAWFHQVPEHDGSYEHRVLGDSAPHPVDLTPQELAELMGPDNPASQIKPATPQSYLDPWWWSLGDVAEFVEANSDNERPETSILFSGLNRVEAAIRSGKLKAYGSIDSAPTHAIAVASWTEFEMVPYDVVHNSEGAISYDILVRSTRSYRASALDDHSHPSGTNVPSAFSLGGEPGYHRIVSNVFVAEREARELFAAKLPKGNQRRIGSKQKRIASTLQNLSIKGKSVYPERGELSFAEITRAVVKAWIKEDERAGKPVEYNQPTEEQAIRRFYLSGS